MAQGDRNDNSTKRSGSGNYIELAKKPLHTLLFLLPLILFYELGSTFFLSEHVAGQVETIRAYRIIGDVFRFLGATGSPVMERVPSVLIVVTLAAWHILNRDTTRIKPKALLGMALESFLWAVPLIVLLQLATGIAGGLMAPVAEVGTGQLASLPTSSLAVISVGAGLYEELLFRLIGITALHLLIVDFFGAKDKHGTALAIGIVAIAFALYHDRNDTAAVVTYLCAGVYFGFVFVSRGFGIVVATHALYNLAVTIVLPMLSSRG